MYIQNLDSVLPVLRSRLIDYLSLKLGKELNVKNRFPCIIHDGDDANMGFNPKTGFETAHCFVCNKEVDIFSAASILDNLPSVGPEWVTTTVPALCDLLEVPYLVGEPSPLEAEKLRLHNIARDISEILQTGNQDLATTRNWNQTDLIVGSISEDNMVGQLTKRGWDPAEIARSLLVRTSSQNFFGEDKITFTIKDERGRPCGFTCRNPNGKTPKYLNTPESLIYQKSKILMGLDTALHSAKQRGLYIVEGPGDLAQLKRLGIENSAATCGTSLTVEHLTLLKTYGIRQVMMCMDWDEAGAAATERIFFNILKQVPGIQVGVVLPPSPGSGVFKDPDELLARSQDPTLFTSLTIQPAFEWVLDHLSDNETTDEICGKLIPIIASEPTAIRRERLIKKLAQFAEISFLSVMQDVNAIRNSKFEERKERLLAAADQYKNEVAEDPENITSIISQHEQTIERIEKEYNRELIGPSYQVNRYDAVHVQRSEAIEGHSGFKMNWFPQFAEVLSGGTSWASSRLMYVGGRANSGKTATCLTIAADIAMSDPEAIVIIHTIDDSYEDIEPRLQSIITKMAHPDQRSVSIGAISNPKEYLPKGDRELAEILADGTEILRNLLAEDRLVVIDAEDGQNLSTLEKNLKYYRQRYPDKKIMVVADNTHNYTDYYDLDQTQRITQISNLQKGMTTRYHCCMIATAEYRKTQWARDKTKVQFPTDDDLADTRALMFRPGVIIHVYNDLHDRGTEFSDIFWTNDAQEVCPRLILNFSKNKVTGFKGKLVLDLDPTTVTMVSVDEEEANKEASRISAARADGRLVVTGKKAIMIEADEYKEEPEEDEWKGYAGSYPRK